MRIRSTSACSQRSAARIRQGPGTSTAPARVLKANGHPQTHQLGGGSNPNVRAAPFVALQTSSKLESGSGQAVSHACCLRGGLGWSAYPRTPYRMGTRSASKPKPNAPPAMHQRSGTTAPSNQPSLPDKASKQIWRRLSQIQPSRPEKVLRIIAGRLPLMGGSSWPADRVRRSIVGFRHRRSSGGRAPPNSPRAGPQGKAPPPSLHSPCIPGRPRR